MFVNKIKWVITCTCIILSTTGCGKTIEQQIAEQLELGQKYFAEQDYEQALVAFNKMIEIDPKQWDAYVGIAEIYEAQEKPDQAVEIMEQGLSVLSVEEVPGEDIDFLVDLYRILAEQALQTGDMELTQTYYQKILELRPETEDIQEEQENLEYISRYRERIERFVQDVTVENESELIHMIPLDEEIRTWMKTLENPVFLPAEDETYIGLYPNGYIYSGEMENGIRQGNGLWMKAGDSSLTVAAGTWIDDKPNGHMTDKEAYEEMQCTFVVDVIDGIYTGTGTMIEFTEHTGEICEYDITFLEGEVQPIRIDYTEEKVYKMAGRCKRCGHREVSFDDHIFKIGGLDD